MVYRESTVKVTGLDMDYSLNPYPHVILKIKCYNKKEKKAFKFFFPAGNKKLDLFMECIMKATELSQLNEAEVQIIHDDRKIYGFYSVEDDEKYLLAISSCEECDRDIFERIFTKKEFEKLISIYSGEDFVEIF